ncbi:MAG TPA: DUF1298 domain-containing protein [Acidimicrobiales bacterium]|nr:DUF1298 domain-containing protein [Acidimicrobiales bacterium]
MAAPREIHFARRMSDAEALMWNIEKDPWLNPSGGMLTLLDRPLDVEKFTRRLAHTVMSVPRLRQRVQPGIGRFTNPSWVDDPEFDLAHHIRVIDLPAPGSFDDLLDMATRLYLEPYDRTRPLWEFVVIGGLADGRGALFSKLHHTITDGAGAMRMAEAYMDLERDVPLDDEIEIPTGSRHHSPGSPSTDDIKGLLTDAAALGRRLATRQMSLTRRVLGEAATYGADPLRAVDDARGIVGQVAQLGSQLGLTGGAGAGSPLWVHRSRHRRFQVTSHDLEKARDAAHALGGSINDFFVAGAVEGAIEYHRRRGVELDHLNVSFVVSTRSDATSGENSFTPAIITVPAGPMDPAARFAEIHRLAARRREGVRGGGLLGAVAGAANLLPTSLVTRAARDQASRIDFATSNFRGAPIPVYIAGGLVEANYPLGPVAGTSFNLTTLSYAGQLDMGILADPEAVSDLPDLRDCIDLGYLRLGEAAGA